MLYENYQNRIKTIADVLKLMLRMWPLVLLKLLIIVAAISAFFITKGMIVSLECPESVVYGESINCNAKAFLSKTHIEYSDGSGKWTEDAPIMPGEYKMRAVGRGVFGNEKPGDAKSFTIEKRNIDLHSKDGTVNYGETPELLADLVYGDVLFCDQFEFGDIYIRSNDELSFTSVPIYELYVSVTPIKNAIVIKDKNGNDVTSAYEISVSGEDLKIIPRKITVTVEDASKVYDGLKLSFDGYQLTDGTLAEGDSLFAYFDKYIIDAGSIENTPKLVLMSEKGFDVTLCYDITIVKGKLTVETRPLIITTGSGEFIYNGNYHTVPDYELDAGTPLVDGHKLSVVPYKAKGAGEHRNTPSVTVISQDGIEVTKNYSIFFNAGTIAIAKLPITVLTGSATVMYNGDYYNFNTFGYQIIKGQLADGHLLRNYDEYDSALYAGTYSHITDVEIYDPNGIDVTSNYDITYEYGTVEIKKLPVTIYSNSLSWIYDGEAHYEDTFSYTKIAYNDTITVTEKAEITDVGTVENRISVSIGRWKYEENGNGSASPGGTLPDIPDNGNNNEEPSATWIDMSDNYEITMVYGELTIVPRPVTLKPVDAKKVYDGTPLTATAVDASPMREYPLVTGHTVTEFKTVGSITEVGSITDYIVEGSVKISDAEGTDVTRNYDISLGVGALTVVPREILVETGSASKEYDGTPLTNGDFGVSDESPHQLVEGHSLYVENIGSITEVGKTENICDLDKTKVYDVTGRDVTANYLATYSYGILEVYDSQGGGGSGGGGGLSESGGIGSGSESGGGEDMLPKLKLKDEKDGFLYLRLKSFGGYTGKGWNEATEYSGKIHGIYSANYLTAFALGQSDYNLEIESLYDQYFLPYYTSLYDMRNHDGQSSDVIYQGDTSKIYSVSYKDYNYKNKYELPEEYAEFEQAYRSFVYSQYLIIDQETREYMETIIEKQGFVGNDINTILRVAKYIQNSARYNLEYDQALDSEDNIAIAFLETYREGICQHYATAATLLYRAMGIPARYTVGYVADTKADEWVEIYEDSAHAWVEVYIDGMGWIEIEATGGEGFGHNGSGGAAKKETIIVKPVYRWKKWDGTALKAIPLLEYDALLSSLVEKGYKYSVSVSGEQTMEGTSESIPHTFVLYDPFGKDVTEDYEIVYENGILEVIAPWSNVISIGLYQLQKYYDGTPISFEKDDYIISGVPSSVKVTIDLNISLTDIGFLTLTDLNENLDKYVTYEITGGDPDDFKIMFTDHSSATSDIIVMPKKYIPIRVDARPLTITASSATKEYDGEYLTCDSYYITKGSLCEGHTLTATLNGSIKRPGEELNMITNVVILDEQGVDVTHNYNITLEDGLLTVTE